MTESKCMHWKDNRHSAQPSWTMNQNTSYHHYLSRFEKTSSAVSGDLFCFILKASSIWDVDFAKTWTGIIESLQGTTCREPQCEDDCNGILGGKCCLFSVTSSTGIPWNTKLLTVYLADLVMSSPSMVLQCLAFVIAINCNTLQEYL